MKPSFLFIDTYYPAFLDYFYKRNKEIISKGYKEQKVALMAECFGTANFYSSNLSKLGYQAEDIVANNEILQKQWAREKGTNFNDSFNFHPARRSPFLNKFFRNKPQFYFRIKDFVNRRNWTYQILMAQIKEYRPDILYILDLGFLPPSFLKEAKRYVKTIVGQTASPLPPKRYFRPYDLILTALPYYLETFRKMGINCEYLRLAFGPRALKIIGPQKRKYQCTFVGGITHRHTERADLLEKLAQKVDIDFWGYAMDPLSESSPLLPKHHGSIWGKEMYKMLAQGKITINSHTEIAREHAVNAKLYEATGMGTLLITDAKDDLGEIFEIGKEVITYKNADDLISKIKYYLKHEEEREKIAKAGQQRTLRNHTYEIRTRRLLNILEKYNFKL